jgi:hypothetical protein
MWQVWTIALIGHDVSIAQDGAAFLIDGLGLDSRGRPIGLDGDMSSLALITNNLMDSARVQSLVPTVVTTRSLSDERLRVADLILLDLASGYTPEEVLALGPPVIAYGPHVDVDRLDAAIAAGCREALPRSKLFMRLPELIS